MPQSASQRQPKIELPRPTPEGIESVGRPLAGPTERVRKGIRRNQSARPEIYPYRALAVTKAYQETEGRPLFFRRAEMLRRILAEQPVKIQDGELIVGMKSLTPRGSPLFPEINCDWVERDLETISTRKDTPFFVSEATKAVLRKEVFPYWQGRQVWNRIEEAVPAECFAADDRAILYNYFGSRTIGHITVGYRKVLEKGMLGIMADVDAALAGLDIEEPGYIHKAQFLASVKSACESAIMFAGRYADEAKHLAQVEEDVDRKAELEKIAAVLEKVPAYPAETFQEALQAFWITQLVLNLETDAHAISPGRFDQYLYPAYRRSIDSGEITQDQAQELLDLLWVKFDEITLAKDGGESETSSSYPEFQNTNIGGLTPDGRDAVNELSYMALTALEHTLLPQPGLSAQIATVTDPRFLLRCCELLRLGTGMPAMFNSDVITLGMVNRGKTLAEARSGSVNGCVSPNCDGLDRMASSGYFNLAKCLELALSNGVERLTGDQAGPRTGDPTGFGTFQELIQAFQAQIRHFVELKIQYDNRMRDIYATYCPVPFTSAVIDDCIATATDWHSGGSRYKQAVISGVGVGTVADALSAIKTHVFDSGAVSMAELIQALDDNWEGHELLRQTLINKTPHYGNDDDAADDLACLTQQLFCDEVEKHRDIQGARYYVNLLPTTAHIALGEATGATPDGRYAESYLSEGLSPVQGHDRQGPTAVAKSVGKLDHARCNGTLLNIKVSPNSLKSQPDLHKLAGLIRGYFDQGGHHCQFNIIDENILREAMAHPDDYKSLLVRVAGYSDYFTILSPAIQKEILARTEHEL